MKSKTKTITDPYHVGDVYMGDLAFGRMAARNTDKAAVRNAEGEIVLEQSRVCQPVKYVEHTTHRGQVDYSEEMFSTRNGKLVVSFNKLKELELAKEEGTYRKGNDPRYHRRKELLQGEYGTKLSHELVGHIMGSKSPLCSCISKVTVAKDKVVFKNRP